MATGFTIVLIASVYVLVNYSRIRKMEEGTPEMVRMAAIIRKGAAAFLVTEFRIVAIAVLVLALVFSLFVEKFSGLTLVLGSLMSSAACIIGMKSATYANVRTANKARVTGDIGQTVQVALCGGSVSGVAVQALGLLGLLIILAVFGKPVAGAVGCGLVSSNTCNPTIVRLTTYSLGCSVTAMFNRVAGGNYTKAADISSDILAKIRHDMPEDDPRSPSVIADFIGDNVNDIAGNCSDLLESFVATIVASLMLSVAFPSYAYVAYPLLLASLGLLGSVAGLVFASVRKMGSNPSRELDMSTWISAIVTVVAGLFVSRHCFASAWLAPWVSTVLGILSGVAIGYITEYYTSADHSPTRRIAEIAHEGDAFVIAKGDAVGSRSCLFPIMIIGVSIFISGKICGTYGIAISALGMLSFVGSTVSIDAFGPIADNAGGLAQACGLDENVRKITDRLDAAGNTTAAIGKGFAIGSAAFATVSLIVAYVGAGHVLDFANFTVIAGGLIGGALIEFFCALLTDNTIESARLMADEGDKQLSMPGVMEGKVLPDYDKAIRMAANQALKKMVVPSLLSVVIPVAGGVLFGFEFAGGILVGATLVATPRALFMGNSGGAFDNAKKYIESGGVAGQGKGSPAHKASVTGDTVGDTRKDVVGVSLDIFIKSMSTVANALSSVFMHFSLF